MAALAWQDILAVVAYFVLVLSIGFYATCRATTSTAQGYFLASKSSNWFLIGTSTFATNVGAPMFIGMVGTAAASGMAVTQFEWHAMPILISLGWLFVPVYRASGCYTMPQYLQLRYGGDRIRIIFACLGVVLSVIWYISSHMYTGALFFQEFFEINIYVAVLIILAVTALYTVIGGLTAVLWTDAIQSFVMIGGATTLSIIGLVKVGGWKGIVEKYPRAAASYVIRNQLLYGNHSCGLPRRNWVHIFRPSDSAEYPWPGMIIGLTILAIFVWCNDQISVQRSLSAKSLSHAKGGMILASFLKITSFLNFTIPGLMSRILFPEEVACAGPDHCMSVCQNRNGCTNIAYPLLVTRILPVGLRGLMLAAVLAGLMSSLTSIFNSASSLFTMDIYRKIRPRAKTSELMVVGRIFIVLLAGLSVAWLPILREIQGALLWDYLVRIASYTMPPFVAAFLMGIFWTRTTEKGAFYGLLAGLVMGLIRIVIEFSRSAPPCGDISPDTQFSVVTRVHFMHFAILSFLLSLIVMVVVSLLTKPRSEEQLARVTFWTRHAPLTQPAFVPEKPVADSDNESPSYSKATDPASLRRHKSWADRVKAYLCGLESGAETRLSQEEQWELVKKSSTIKEDPRTRRLLDVGAVITVAVCVFLHAFFY